MDEDKGLGEKIAEKIWPYRKNLAKFSKIPLLGNVMEGILHSDKDGAIRLPKNEVVQVNEYIESPENVALPSKVAEHFVREACYIFKMDFCICRRSNQCDDYPIDLGCLFLGEAAKDIAPKYGEPVSEEEALEHLEECREAGLIHLVGRVRLDAVALDVNPEAKLMTLCSCCPCCCITDIFSKGSDSIGERFSKMPGINVNVTGECLECGTCVDICPMDAIEIEDGEAKIGEECRGCGRCVDVCPNDAIELTIEDSEFFRKSIKRIENKVDVS